MKKHLSSMDQAKPAPKLFAWLASAALLILIFTNQFLPVEGTPILKIGGVAILLTAAVFIFAPFSLLAKHGKSKAGGTYMQAGEVVDRGLYAVIRHPQYCGYMLLAVGFALLSFHWVAAVLAGFSSACFYIQAVQEEEYLVAQFGESYRRYIQRVPRFNLIQGVWRVFRNRNER